MSATGEGNGDSPADAFLRTVIDLQRSPEMTLVCSREVVQPRGAMLAGVPVASMYDLLSSVVLS